MEKKIRIYNFNDPAQYDDDVEYWSKISPEEKLSITQDLREQHIKLFNKQKLYDESRKAIRTHYKIVSLKSKQ